MPVTLALKGLPPAPNQGHHNKEPFQGKRQLKFLVFALNALSFCIRVELVKTKNSIICHKDRKQGHAAITSASCTPQGCLKINLAVVQDLLWPEGNEGCKREDA